MPGYLSVKAIVRWLNLRRSAGWSVRRAVPGPHCDPFLPSLPAARQWCKGWGALL